MHFYLLRFRNREEICAENPSGSKIGDTTFMQSASRQCLRQLSNFNSPGQFHHRLCGIGRFFPGHCDIRRNDSAGHVPQKGTDDWGENDMDHSILHWSHFSSKCLLF